MNTFDYHSQNNINNERVFIPLKACKLVFVYVCSKTIDAMVGFE